MERLLHEQALISLKKKVNAYSIDREYVNSKEYHDKFTKLPVNHEVQEALYKEAGRLLEFVDGQEEERMIAVSARTGMFIVGNLQRNGSIRGTGFTHEEYKKIQTLFSEYLEETKSKTDDIEEAKRLATTRLYILNETAKIFDIRRL